MSGLLLPDDARITITVGQFKAILEGRERQTFDGIGTIEAAKLTKESGRALRRLWASWDRIQRDGGRPPVRVSRKGSSDRSDLLFDRADCIAYGQRERHPDRPPAYTRTHGSPADPTDEVDGIVDRLLAATEGDRAS